MNLAVNFLKTNFFTWLGHHPASAGGASTSKLQQTLLDHLDTTRL